MTDHEEKNAAGGVALEWSHDRVRTITRTDQVPPLPSVESVPMPRQESGRFAPGNRAWRLRQLKARAEGIATLDASKAPSWLRPFIEQGAAYATALLAILDGKPALAPLASDCADAHTLYRALLSLALAAEGKEQAALLAEARAWLKEHRTAIATLSKLAGDIKLPRADHRLPWQPTDEALEAAEAQAQAERDAEAAEEAARAEAKGGTTP